jgi:Tfp pilus assembly protein FimT
MVELLIVMALTIGVAVSGFTGFNSFRKSQTLKLGVQELAATLSATRQRAIAQENGSGWGVRLTSATSTEAHTYKVFPGSSFLATSTTQNYVLGRGAKFSNPQASSTMDIVFAGATGFPSTTQVISLINGFTDGAVGDVIIKSLGSIITRLDNGLVGYWHLDEGTATTTYDASGYGNNGALVSSPTWTSGSNCKAGRCLSFNGSTNYILGPSSNSITGNNNQAITISAWIKTSASTAQYPVAVKRSAAESTLISLSSNQNSSGVASAGNLGFLTRDSGDTAHSYLVYSGSYNDGQWHYLVAVVNGSSRKLYIDGVERGSDSVGMQSVSNNTAPTTIGSFGASHFFNGTIDEVKIYNRALSASEILAAYNDLK